MYDKIRGVDKKDSENIIKSCVDYKDWKHTEGEVTARIEIEHENYRLERGFDYHDVWTDLVDDPRLEIYIVFKW